MISWKYQWYIYLLNMTVSWIWLPLTSTAHHPWTTSPIMHCTHTFPSTITPITQLSPFTHQPWLPHHTCTSFTHSHKSSTQTLIQCEVLFSPGYISERISQFVFPCTTWTVDLLFWSFAACLSDLACWYLLCLLPAPTLHCPCCWFCLAFTTPVTTFDHCLSDHLLSSLKLLLDLTTLPLHYRQPSNIVLIVKF